MEVYLIRLVHPPSAARLSYSMPGYTCYKVPRPGWTPRVVCVKGEIGGREALEILSKIVGNISDTFVTLLRVGKRLWSVFTPAKLLSSDIGDVMPVGIGFFAGRDGVWVRVTPDGDIELGVGTRTYRIPGSTGCLASERCVSRVVRAFRQAGFRQAARLIGLLYRAFRTTVETLGTDLDTRAYREAGKSADDNDAEIMIGVGYMLEGIPEEDARKIEDMLIDMSDRQKIIDGVLAAEGRTNTLQPHALQG